MIFLEALRQFQFNIGTENIMFIHVSLVPALGSVGEQKTKPTQHSVKELRSVGMSPDIIVCRSSNQLDAATKAKISGFCHVSPSHVLAVHDVSNIYHVPLLLAQQNIHTLIRDKLGLQSLMTESPDLTSWRVLASNVDAAAANAKQAISDLKVCCIHVIVFI
jgi:CTP synthase